MVTNWPRTFGHIHGEGSNFMTGPNKYVTIERFRAKRMDMAFWADVNFLQD